MWIDDDAKLTADNIFRANYPADTKVVALNIGASWLTKRWIDTYFAECADIFINFLKARLWYCVSWGGNMDKRDCYG